MWAQIINAVLGLVVMIVPGIWQFDESASNNNYIVGPFVITFALTAVTDAARNLRWMNIPAGAWLIFSPLILGYGTPAVTINIFLGILIVLFSLFRGKVENRFGGGWRSLLKKNPKHLQEANKAG